MKSYLKAGVTFSSTLFMMWGGSSDMSTAPVMPAAPIIPTATLPSPYAFQAAVAGDPLLYSTLNGIAAVMAPAFGTGLGASISTARSNNFVTARVGKGLLANASGERVRYPQVNGGVQNIELESGTMDFWYRPNYNHDDNHKYTIAGTGNWPTLPADRRGSMHFGKHNSSNNNDLFLILHDGNAKRFEHTVAVAKYNWRAGDWIQMRITWDFNVPAGEQNLHLYMNGAELPLTRQVSRGPQQLPAERSTEMIYLGSRGVSGRIIGNGTYDELRIWGNAIPPV